MEKTFNRIFERILVFTTAVSLILTATGVFSTVINKAEFEVQYINIFTHKFFYLLLIGFYIGIKGTCLLFEFDDLSFFMLLDCRNTDITNPHRYLPPKCKVKSKSMLLFYQSNIILYFER